MSSTAQLTIQAYNRKFKEEAEKIKTLDILESETELCNVVCGQSHNDLRESQSLPFCQLLSLAIIEKCNLRKSRQSAFAAERPANLHNRKNVLALRNGEKRKGLAYLPLTVDKDVSWMRVCLEKPISKNHLSICCGQALQNIPAMISSKCVKGRNRRLDRRKSVGQQLTP